MSFKERTAIKRTVFAHKQTKECIEQTNKAPSERYRSAPGLRWQKVGGFTSLEDNT